MITKSVSLIEQRARLERRAGVIRDRLLRTIDALDGRRHQAQELGHHVKRLARPLGLALAGAAVLALGAAFALRGLAERRRERRLGFRLTKAMRSARAQARPSLGAEILRKVTLIAVSVLASELAKRSARMAFDRRAIGPAQPPMPALLER